MRRPFSFSEHPSPVGRDAPPPPSPLHPEQQFVRPFKTKFPKETFHPFFERRFPPWGACSSPESFFFCLPSTMDQIFSASLRKWTSFLAGAALACPFWKKRRSPHPKPPQGAFFRFGFQKKTLYGRTSWERSSRVEEMR